MKRATAFLHIIYSLAVLLLILDSLNGFDIKSQMLKCFSYFSVLIGTPAVLAWNLFSKTQSKRKPGWIFFTAVILVVVALTGPMKFFFTSGAWCTQTVMYEHGHFSFKTIEFQMQDLGALGYKSRTVEVLYLTPLFIIINDFPCNVEPQTEWIKVDKDINELGLKYP
ncbi:MAG: hypothetical protein EOP48_06360 [Sphingobacteriales bacterium]|nr:MAG: hypothetical protein EOP48_06360 [Sphingobacteriales bacterium]